jgi:mRNA interferase MazF
MLRGEIHLVELGAAQPGEAAARRPAVIVSNDGANTMAARLGTGVVTVVPLTTNLTRIYPFQVLLPSAKTGLNRDSKAQAEQVRSISVERVQRRVGMVPAPLMLEIDEALRLHLAL